MRLKTDELAELLIEIEAAADDHYADMDDDEFEESWEDFEDEDADPVGAIMFRAYARQRESGFGAFREEIGAKVAAVGDAEDLHVLAASIGSNGPAWQTMVIGSHPWCDAVTARLLYWDRAPHEVHAQRHEGGGVSGWDAEAVAGLERRALTVGFLEGLDLAFMDEIAEDPGEMLEIARPNYDAHLADVKPELDFSSEPYSGIPAVFR